MSILSTVLLIIALLAGNAFFVACEFSMVSSRKDRIEALLAQGQSGARRVLYAIENLSLMLAGAQFGITICSLILGKVAEPAVTHYLLVPLNLVNLPDNLLHSLGFLLALAIITFLHILFGEMVPKNIALAGPETLAIWLSPAMIFWVKITKPLVEFFNWLARITLHLFGVEQRDELDTTVSQSELASMIQESRSEGLLDAEEHVRLKNALRSDLRTVEELTIPSEELRCLSSGRTTPSLQSLETALEETGFSRFPVVDDAGRMKGYIHFKDVLDLLSNGDPQSPIPPQRIRELEVIEASSTLEEAVGTMHQLRAHLAQVASPNGIIGVVFLEDIIEEYIGIVEDGTHLENA